MGCIFYQTNPYLYFSRLNPMKKGYFLVAAVLFFGSGTAQILNFPDANFKAKLLASSTSNNIATTYIGTKIKIDANNNGEIEASEITGVNRLELDNAGIASLEGIAAFTNLYELNCSHNQLVSLDLNSLHRLMLLDCSFNQLTTVVYDSPEMTSLLVNDNQLTSLDISASPLGYQDIMGYFYMVNNPITQLYALNALPYQADTDFRLAPSLTNLCCATQANMDWFQFLADLQNVTTIAIDNSCLLQVETPSQKSSSLSPNPVNTMLTIDTAADVISYRIYTMLGQPVLEIPKAQHLKTIDVSGLKTGSYFLKVEARQGTFTLRFVKR